MKSSRERVFENVDLFVSIILKTDPRTFLSLISCSKKIKAEILAIDNGEKDDQKASDKISYISELLCSSLAVPHPKASTLKDLATIHIKRFDAIRENVLSLCQERNMGIDEDLKSLRWEELPLLRNWMIASDTLLVGQWLAKWIGAPQLLISTTKRIDAYVEEANQFPQWCKENLCQLTQLQELCLSWSGLTALPTEVCELGHLKKLDLSWNQFTALPAEIGQLAQLEELDLMNNLISALPPQIGQLTNLRALRLKSNKLLAFPREVTELTQLNKLCLAENNLKTLPAEIEQLTQLEELDLMTTELTVMPTVICKLTQLKELRLGWNNLTHLPAAVSQLTSLKILDLGCNKFSKPPSEVAQLESKGCRVVV